MPDLSVNEYPTDGTRTSYDINFAGGYISRDHVEVVVFDYIDPTNGDLINAYEPVWTFIGDYQLSITPAIPAGKIVRIYRNTPYTAPLVDFSDGSIINEKTLDLNAKQAVFLAAELRDRIGNEADLARFYEILNDIADDIEDTSAIVAGVADSYFSQISSVRVPVNQKLWRSRGFSSDAWGDAVYIADAVATSALATSYPEAVKADQNGRLFRLLGTPDGFVTPEMFGCPPYANGVNSQPYIQKAVNYAAAVGLKGVYFKQGNYELWCPQRIAPANQGYDNKNHTGEFIVIPERPIILQGRSGNRSILRYKGPNGGSLLTDYQVVTQTGYGGEVIWRGAGVKLAGSVSNFATRPDTPTLSHLIMRDMVIFTDAVGVQSQDWPAWPRSRDPSGARENCWDISNKGIYCQQDVHIGNLIIENVDVIGFLGECIYMPNSASAQTGTQSSIVKMRNYVAKHSNGQAINCNGPNICDIDGLYAENNSQTIEGWAGIAYGRMANCHFKDSIQGQLTGGNQYPTPLRPADNSQPILTVNNVVFENCGTVHLGSYVHGDITLIDTMLSLTVFSSTSLCRNNRLTVNSLAHKMSVPYAIRFPGRTDAPDAISNNTIRLDLGRTRYADDNNFFFNGMIYVANGIGLRNYLYARGVAGSLGGAVSVTGNHIAMIDEGLDLSVLGALPVFDPSTTPSPDMSLGFLRGATFSGGDGNWPVNLPATTMYPQNAELVIEHRDSGKPNAFMEVKDTTGTLVGLVGYRNRIKFRCNKTYGRWDLVEAPAPIRATTFINIPSTVLGAESGPYSITAPGSQPYLNVSVRPASLLTGFVITAVRPEAGAVKFWVKNIDGTNPLDPPGINFTAVITA